MLCCNYILRKARGKLSGFLSVHDCVGFSVGTADTYSEPSCFNQFHHIYFTLQVKTEFKPSWKNEPTSTK